MDEPQPLTQDEFFSLKIHLGKRLGEGLDSSHDALLRKLIARCEWLEEERKTSYMTLEQLRAARNAQALTLEEFKRLSRIEERPDHEERIAKLERDVRRLLEANRTPPEVR